MRLQLTSSRAHLFALLTLFPAAGALSCAGEGGAHPAKPPAVPRPNLLSVTVEQDFGIVSGESPCSRTGQLEGGFACFRADQTQYHGTPKIQSPNDASNLYLATTRLLASYDRVVGDNWALGARAGAVLRGGGPKPDGANAPSFLPFHGELRAAYWFGSAPFAGEGFRAGLFVAGGIAQVDSLFQVDVAESTKAPRPVAQPDNPKQQTLDAYSKAGTGFAGGGLSLAYAFLPMSAFVLHVKVMGLFPSAGAALAPELGYEHAF